MVENDSGNVTPSEYWPSISPTQAPLDHSCGIASSKKRAVLAWLNSENRLTGRSASSSKVDTPMSARVVALAHRITPLASVVDT